MDKFVKGENEMWNAREGMHSNKIVAASAMKRVLDFRFVPRHSLEDVQVNRNTHRLLRSNHP